MVWSDSKKHQVTEPLEEKGSESVSGHQPDPEEVTGAENIEPKDTLDMAKEVGLHTDADEEHPDEL